MRLRVLIEEAFKFLYFVCKSPRAFTLRFLGTSLLNWVLSVPVMAPLREYFGRNNCLLIVNASQGLDINFTLKLIFALQICIVTGLFVVLRYDEAQNYRKQDMVTKRQLGLSQVIEKSLEDSKAQNIAMIDLLNKSSLCDYIMIATGTSSRHVNSIVTNLQKSLKNLGLKGLLPEGSESASWVVLDAGDVIVHVFQEEARDRYKLEELWAER